MFFERNVGNSISIQLVSLESKRIGKSFPLAPHAPRETDVTTATASTLVTTATASTDAPQIRPSPPYAPCSSCSPLPPPSQNAGIAASVACSPWPTGLSWLTGLLGPTGPLGRLKTVEPSPPHSVLQRPSTPYSALQRPSKLPVDNMKRPPGFARTWIRLHVRAFLTAPERPQPHRIPESGPFQSGWKGWRYQRV